mgnify:CR=1 FL=1
MNQNDIRMFLTIAKTGSLNQAAGHLFVTQPALKLVGERGKKGVVGIGQDQTDGVGGIGYKADRKLIGPVMQIVDGLHYLFTRVL